MKFKKFFKRFIGACALAVACVLSCSVKTHAYYYDNVSGNIISSNLFNNDGNISLSNLGLISGQQYTLSVNANIFIIKCCSGTNPMAISPTLFEATNSSQITFTYNDVEDYNLFFISSDYDIIPLINYNIMLVKGESALPYEPYGAVWYNSNSDVFQQVSKGWLYYVNYGTYRDDNGVWYPDGFSDEISLDLLTQQDALNLSYINLPQFYGGSLDVGGTMVSTLELNSLPINYFNYSTASFTGTVSIYYHDYSYTHNYSNSNTVSFADFGDELEINFIDTIVFTYQQEQVNTLYLGLGYSQGYSNGYNKGYNDGQLNGYTNGVNDTADNKYNEGYSVGYQDAKTKYDGTDNSLGNMILTIADTPVHLFRSIFNFDILGVNIYGFISSLATLLICVWVVKKVI